MTNSMIAWWSSGRERRLSHKALLAGSAWGKRKAQKPEPERRDATRTPPVKRLAIRRPHTTDERACQLAGFTLPKGGAQGW